MLYLLLALGVVIIHVAFVAFVLAGALLVPRWPRIRLLHIPAVIWAVFVQVSGWDCPLTPFENHLRAVGGVSSYRGGFLDHYLRGTDEPTRAGAILLGLLALALNLVLYARVRRAHAETRAA